MITISAGIHSYQYIYFIYVSLHINGQTAEYGKCTREIFLFNDFTHLKFLTRKTSKLNRSLKV